MDMPTTKSIERRRIVRAFDLPAKAAIAADPYVLCVDGCRLRVLIVSARVGPIFDRDSLPFLVAHEDIV